MINVFFAFEVPGFRATKSMTVFDRVSGIVQKIISIIEVDENKFPKKAEHFTAVYSRDKEYL